MPAAASRHTEVSLAEPASPALDAGAAASRGRRYSITDLAQELDVTPRAIRFYEDMGLLQPQRAGRNGVYSQRDRTRLRLTLRGKRLGLSLADIRQLVDMYDSPSDTAPREIAQHESRCRALLDKVPPAVARRLRAAR